MQIPQFWAEARVEGKVQGRQRVVRRFGWSDASEADAQQQAFARARSALAELQAGRWVVPRELKTAYGDGGLPIREQVLARRGTLVVTRNSYGAHCLNEPDVLFADIDTDARLPRLWERLFSFATRDLLLLTIGGGLLLFAQQQRWSGCALALLALPALSVLLGWRRRLLASPRMRQRARAQAMALFERVVRAVPGARFACYETPAGWRLLALHATYDPADPATARLLRDLGSDPAFVQMCELQRCFRARTSGKPWRMGVRHIVPRPGIWPVHPDRMARRATWIAEYEAAAANFAACRFIGEIGDGPVHPRCAEVQRLHDELSRARTDLPLA
ncbi:MAG: hypothetical protein JNL08_18015 [Planctomycetes bacterium]|nr:hypothetical protein [Planctomycetota bacterium]